LHFDESRAVFNPRNRALGPVIRPEPDTDRTLIVPIYVYETVPGEGKVPTCFEVIQRMSDPALTEHPETGEPVRRIIMAPALSLKHSAARERDLLSDANLSRHGFSRYERAGDGTYARTAGSEGPRRISAEAAGGVPPSDRGR
jgi:predicted nucleic acid-binding Zn ribbon protein